MSDSTTGADLVAEAELAQLRLELAKAQAEAAAARLKAAEAEIARKAADRAEAARTEAARTEAARKSVTIASTAVADAPPSAGQNGVPAIEKPRVAPPQASESNGSHRSAETVACISPPGVTTPQRDAKNRDAAPPTRPESATASPKPPSPPPAKVNKPAEKIPADKKPAEQKTAPSPVAEKPIESKRAETSSGALADDATVETMLPTPRQKPPVLVAPPSEKPKSTSEEKPKDSPKSSRDKARRATHGAAAKTTAAPPASSSAATSPVAASSSAASTAAKPPALPSGDASQQPTPASRERTAGDPSAIDEEVNLPSYRSLTRMVGSSLMSAVVHVAFLIALGMWYAEIVTREEPEIVSVPIPQETVTEVLDTRITPAENPNDAATSESLQSAATPGVGGIGSPFTSDSATQLDQAAVENADPVYFTPGELAQISGIPGTGAIKEIDKDFKGDPSAVVDSMDEALDRITHEILQMLQKGDVLVVWLFDESESMKDDRAEIQARITRVYTELGLKDEAKAGHLAGAVASYGSKWHVHTQVPTTNTDKLMNDIGAVIDDDSGNEMLCQSVQTSIEFYKQYAQKTQRQMAVVLVTDESGDPNTNNSHLELAINSAKDARARIYCIGREAVFGYPYAYMAWTDPSTQITYWLQIDRGPETPGVEALQTHGLWRRTDAHPSGFGPYEQTRMCRETGGIFFMLPSPETLLVGRDNRKYELAKMRPYLPSLERRDFYDNEISRSRLRSTVKKVIYDLNPWKIPQIDMRQEFTIEGPALRDQIVQELGKIKQYVLYLDAAEQAMKVIEPDRQNLEIYPRWQANYDLIYAQILSYKVRLYQYGAFLQSFLEKPRPPALKPPANVLATATYTDWNIITVERLLPTTYWPIEDQEKYIAEATRRFNQVIKDHEGTPWAARAQWEISRGFGVDFVQGWDDPRRGQGVKLPKY